MLVRVICSSHVTNRQLSAEVFTIRLGIMDFVGSLPSRLYYLAKVVFTLGTRAVVPSTRRKKLSIQILVLQVLFSARVQGLDLVPSHQHCA